MMIIIFILIFIMQMLIYIVPFLRPKDVADKTK